MRASLGAPSCVLLVLLALCAAAPSSSTPASTSSNRMLRDTRKLQPAVFLKVWGRGCCGCPVLHTR
jgi:hypothetical protein